MIARCCAHLLVAGLAVGLGLVFSPADAARFPWGGAGDDDQGAVDLLHRSATAMRDTSYSGTRVVSAWGRQGAATTVLVDVVHVAGQGTRLSMRGGEVGDDRAGDDGAATFLSARAWRDRTAESGGLTLEALDLLTDSYAVTAAERDSVAGRPATVVEASRAGAVAARLWIDDRTGLLLRREVFDASGRLVSESAFIDLDVTRPRFLSHLPPSAPEPAIEGQGLAHGDHAAASGWDCPVQAGPMRLVGMETLDGTGTLHRTYSDGITRMSVFEQPGSLDPGSVRGFAVTRWDGHVVHVREGIPTYVVWEDDGQVLTAVTDGPLDGVAALVTHGPAYEAEPGFWERVTGGLARLGGWAAPLV